MNEYTKSIIFLDIEKLFVRQFYKKNYLPYQEKLYLNVCCDENDEADIIMISDIIKNYTKYKDLSIRDVYLVIIYIYYSLRMNEPTEDWLTFKFLEKNAIYFEGAKKLYFDITFGDIIIEDINFSSKVRRYVMEMDC